MVEKRFKSRIPIIYKGKPLTPIRWGRAKKFVREGKGKFKYDRSLGLIYLKLLIKPSGTEIPITILGDDTGTHFEGISVISGSCHLVNVEIIFNRTVKKNEDSQRSNRRIRRNYPNKRQRKVKFSHKTKSKYPNTVWSMFSHKKHIIDNLSKLYPINRITEEEVKYNHFKDRGKNKGKKARGRSSKA
jgi:hypothetical protein